MKKILIPIDFSPNAENAMNYALKVAEKTGAEIILLHAFHAPVVDPNVPGDMMASMIKDVEKSTNLKLKEIVKKINATKEFAKIRCKIISVLGFAIEEIIATSADKNIDLIIMGTAGASGLKELMLGSNTASVIEKSRVPVLAVPEKAKFKKIDKIVYATDFSSNDLPVIKKIISFAEIFDSHIAVLHISSSKEKDVEEKLDKLFTETKYKLSFEKLSFHISNSEKILEGINNFIDNFETDIISMATHERGLMNSIFHKSMTKKMAYHTHIPLLTYHKPVKE